MQALSASPAAPSEAHAAPPPLGSGPPRRLGVVTATALVVASMVGTGVFTTTGLLVEQIPSAPAVLACWAVGGLAALCGALAYAELGAALPSNGGEYHYLSKLVHPVVGFSSAFASLVVGFAAPLAAMALSFGSYLQAFAPGVSPRIAGGALIVLLSLVHVWRVSLGARVQNALTVGKVALILGFVAVGLTAVDLTRLTEPQPKPFVSALVSPGFALGLLFVSFAYSGWNASAYVAGEVEKPERVLPRSLMAGTAIVVVLYLALNLTFLAAAPLPELAGQIAVGHVAAVRMLGPVGGKVLSAIVMVGLVSTVGAVIVTGPRVYEAVGRDVPRLAWLARRSADGGPVVAIALQGTLALAMMLTASFEALLTYVGFLLSLFGAITVGAVFLLRRRAGLGMPFRAPGHPVGPLVYIALMTWMVAQAVVQRPIVALAGLGTIVIGLAVYLLSGGSRHVSRASS